VELHDAFMGRHTELEGEWEIIHRDGHRISVLANAAYITDVDGRPKKVTFVTDITTLRTAQQHLEAEIAERKRVERLRDEVERVMRHDLRNPIDGIRTAANFLLEEDLTARQAEFVQLMYDAAVRARTRIDSSLAYARMQRGQYVIERKRVNLVQLVRDVLRDIDSTVRAYRVRIDTSYRGRPLAAQFDVELWGEHDFLSDAITNLTRNAIEASEAEQVVSLIVDDEVMMEGGIPAVSVTIHNETPIPAEIRARLFDPWVTHGKRGGSGLGTYTALLVVQAHGGTIAVDSDAARGTTVTIVLPRGRMGDPGAPVSS
jgi:signal transduction histidine kinase